ncbi:hypothetical protein K1X11_018405 [Actomonas aquatica]|uniref:Uncharacterized protein n=1 Tax=Actomonas aquatica TaxID=2866162 RepID=A0ABZ1C4X5_9BACT|nr:hypothetical protein [Opitutus sp. WL0086]WRQ86788.1 hypothetical protein K1X11_018405 [Opitutus sp. WL0086]
MTIATFVMAFGISTSTYTVMSGFKTLDVARNITLSSQILQSEMERLRLMDWGDIAALSGTNEVDLNAVFTTDAHLAAQFTLTRTVSDVAGKVGEMKEILLVVSWTTVDGRPLTRQFKTFYAKDGLYDYYYTLARS